jgi:hypothetical protein
VDKNHAILLADVTYFTKPNKNKPGRIEPIVGCSYHAMHGLRTNVHSNNRWPPRWVQSQGLPNIRFSACFFSLISRADRAGLDLDLSSSFSMCCAYRFSSSNDLRISLKSSCMRRSPHLTPSAYSDPNCSGSIRRILPSFLDCMPQVV